ncbi:hypothetical protein THER_1588 [Thermodesulfovibrio sp. N1]|uniref:hypothetical protein n=1 Tax=unclassified Thermodesulfovibrio TaxID=2645936 RepID=UPI00083AA997|nr:MULTISPECIES: hypothetical protein [unclassified Thermodesulfovibrio]MDI1471489.1 hypothetical protein [Thermodesulfovibrio sp. 1176]ODA43678.1 hypothetical protein THER_1588 [Thermodesulfovibrio sp. N1]
MLSNEEIQFIKKNAYIPEHLLDYVISVSEATPFLYTNYLFYLKDGFLTFIGYSLNEKFESEEIKEVLNYVVSQYKPKSVALISPFFIIPQDECIESESDFYYRIDLSNFRISSKLKNSINRAKREVEIEKTNYITDEHISLIDEFVKLRQIDDYRKYIFYKIQNYLENSNTVQVYNAINSKGKLVAFDVADYGAEKYAFYMFNFINRRFYVPGVSDLLLYNIIETAIKQKKYYLNLGLGINKGVVFFKKKWEGYPFLRHEFCFYNVKVEKKFSIKKFFKKLFQKLY